MSNQSIKTNLFNFRVNDNTIVKLRTIILQTGESISAVIEECLQDYIEERQSYLPEKYKLNR